MAGGGAELTRFLLVEFWLAVLYAMYAGALVPLLTEIMPAKVRSSGYANRVPESRERGMFGTFTPTIALGLTALLQDRAAPAALAFGRCRDQHRHRFVGASLRAQAGAPGRQNKSRQF